MPSSWHFEIPFLHPRNPLGSHFSTQEPPWAPFEQLGSTLGSYFGGSEASGDAILAPRTHPGEPWEQQAGQEVARHRI